MALTFLLTSDQLQPLRLTTAPVGHRELKYLLVRDPQRHGMMLTASADLTFWKEAAAYLRTLYEGGLDKNGQAIPAGFVDANAVLNMYEWDPNEFRTSLVLRQRIDFTTYRPTEMGVQVKLKELGFATAVLARSDSPIDLFGNTSLGGNYLTPPTPQAVTLHSQMLRLKYAASQTGSTDLSPGLMFGDEDDESHEQILYFGLNTAADNDLGLEPVAGGFFAGNTDTVVPILPIDFNGPLTVELDLLARIEAHNNSNGPEFETVEGDCYLKLTHRDGTATAHKLVPDFYEGALGGDYIGNLATGPQSYTFNAQIGDALQLYARYFVHDIGGGLTGIRYRTNITATMLAGSYLRITAESTTPATNCRGLLAHEAFQRLTEAMTDEPTPFYSEHFGRTDCEPAYAQDGPGALRLLTNGFGIRTFPLTIDTLVVDPAADPRKALTASFQQVYGGLDATDCLGCGFEQRNGRPVLRVEPRTYFYQAAETLALGVVAGLAKTPLASELYNQVEVGYQRWQSGLAVGLDEFNGLRTYALPLLSVKATYSAVSSLITAGYVLEQARRQLYALGTNKEGAADQELFLICLRRAPGGTLVTERAEDFGTVAGILAPDSTYNLRLAPGRGLRKHAPFFRGCLAAPAAAGKKLLLTKAEGNDKLKSQLLSESAPVDEHESPLITDLAAPVYLAETYEFTARLRRHQVRALMARPYGKISFLDRSGNRKMGYLSKAEIEPATGKASFTLLRAS